MAGKSILHDPERFLEFLNVDFHLASEDTEIVTTCPSCWKYRHLYIHRLMHVFFCQRCNETGDWSRFLLLYLEGWASRPEVHEYFVRERGLPEEIVRGLKLGYCPTLDRYVIPYWSVTKEEEQKGLQAMGLETLVFRAARPSQEPKYLHLPHTKVSGYKLDLGVPRNTIIVEGEIDAISLFAALKDSTEDTRILGISAGTLTKNAQALVVGNVRVIHDNDPAGQQGAKRVQKILGPERAEVLTLPSEYKDINEMYKADPEALKALIHTTEVASITSETPPDAGHDIFTGLLARDYVAASSEEVPWLVEDIWYDKAIGFIAGIPKSLKSTLAANLAVSVAGRNTFLGYPVLRNGPVLFFQEEDADFVTRERLAALLADNPQAAANLYVFTPTTMRENLILSMPESVEKLEKTVEHYRPILVILDPFANISGVDDENKAVEVNRILESLRHLRDRYGTSVAIVHHMRKTLPGETGAWGQRMRGSGVFHAKTECALYTEVSDGIIYIRAEAKTRPIKEILARYLGRGKFEVLKPPDEVNNGTA